MKRSLFCEDSEITRREFVKTTAAGAAGLAFMNWPGSEVQANQKYPYWRKHHLVLLLITHVISWRNCLYYILLRYLAAFSASP